MAKSDPALDCFEDLVFCPVCFEVYKDPQSLLCRHTVCLTCVISLTKNEEIKCPLCRKTCKKNDIAADYNTSKYVEFYTLNELDDISDRKKCQACCIAPACPDVRYCFACSQSMRMGLINGSSKSSEQLSKVARASLNQMKSKLEMKKEIFSTWSDFIQAEMWKLKHIENLLTKWHETVNKKIFEVNELINSDNDGDVIEKGPLMNQDVMYVLESMENQVKINKTLLDSFGFNTHVQGNDDFNQPIWQVKLAEKETPKAVKVDTTVTVEETLSRQTPLPVTSPRPFVIERPRTVPAPVGLRQAALDTPGYSCLTTYKMAELSIHGSICSISTANDRLLLQGDKCLYVLDRDCKLQNRINYSNYDGCKNVVKRGAGPEAHLIVGGTNGLTVLNMKGRIRDKVSSNSVHHMTTVRHFIYTLSRRIDNGNRIIDMYEKFKLWTRIQTLTFKQKNASEHDTLGVANYKFYIGSFANHGIYVYNATGDLIFRYGKHGEEVKTKVAGRFQNPRLVHADNNGDLLIADVGNKKLQKRSASGEWSVVSTEVGSPWDVVIDNDIMWVLTNNGELIKFTKETTAPS